MLKKQVGSSAKEVQEKLSHKKIIILLDTLILDNNPYQLNSVEHFSLFTELLYVHLWRKTAVTIYTEATHRKNRTKVEQNKNKK